MLKHTKQTMLPIQHNTGLPVLASNREARYFNISSSFLNMRNLISINSRWGSMVNRLNKESH